MATPQSNPLLPQSQPPAVAAAYGSTTPQQQPQHVAWGQPRRSHPKCTFLSTLAVLFVSTVLLAVGVAHPSWSSFVINPTRGSSDPVTHNGIGLWYACTWYDGGSSANRPFDGTQCSEVTSQLICSYYDREATGGDDDRPFDDDDTPAETDCDMVTRVDVLKAFSMLACLLQFILLLIWVVPHLTPVAASGGALAPSTLYYATLGFSVATILAGVISMGIGVTVTTGLASMRGYHKEPGVAWYLHFLGWLLSIAVIVLGRKATRV